MLFSWLVERLDLTKEDACSENNDAFASACGKGNLDIAIWLADKFELTLYDVMANNNRAFRDACAKGHTHVTAWIIERFGLTKSDLFNAGIERIINEINWDQPLGPKSASKTH